VKKKSPSIVASFYAFAEALFNTIVLLSVSNMLCLLYKGKCFVFTRRVPRRVVQRPAVTGGEFRRRSEVAPRPNRKNRIEKNQTDRRSNPSRSERRQLHDDVSAAFALVALAIVADAREMASVM
jgi:hypothetical protein